MYRLAILTHLRRRFPIQVLREAIIADLVNVYELLDSPFINSEGRFQWLELARTPMVSTLARYSTPAVDQAVISAASGDRLKTVTELLGTNAHDNNGLERAEARAPLGLPVSRGLRLAHLQHLNVL